MFPVERDKHAEVLARWPELVEHPVLPKWLYLSASSESFETLGTGLVAEIVRGNPLFGVIPPAKRSRSKKKADGPKKRSLSKDEKSVIPPYLLK